MSPAKLQWKGEGLSDLGCYRTTNEDRFYINDDVGLYIVADGIGGIPGGEVAAGIIIDHLPELLKQSLPKDFDITHTNMQTLIHEKILAINDFVYREGFEQNLKEMGSTLMCVLVQDTNAFFINVGDSRAYIYNENTLRQISKDHTSAQELVDADKITQKESLDHPGSSELTEAIGMLGPVEIHSTLRTLTKNDTILLCSDGLTDMLTDNQIAVFLKDSGESVGPILIKEAKNEGGDDNITLILINTK